MPRATIGFYLFNFRNKEGRRGSLICPRSAEHCRSVYLAKIHSLGKSAPIRPPASCTLGWGASAKGQQAEVGSSTPHGSLAQETVVKAVHVAGECYRQTLPLLVLPGGKWSLTQGGIGMFGQWLFWRKMHRRLLWLLFCSMFCRKMFVRAVWSVTCFN